MGRVTPWAESRLSTPCSQLNWPARPEAAERMLKDVHELALFLNLDVLALASTIMVISQ